MGESFSKKEKKNKKAKAKEDKVQKMRERKASNNKGKGLEDMLAYVDENGNLSSSPPKGKSKDIALDDIRIGATPRPPEDPTRTGVVTFFNLSRGFGFITDDKSKESVFFHINQLSQPVKEKEKVTFSWERTARGYNAVDVKPIDSKPKNTF
ncbi:MAG TPA: cold shock domain-containing protein [Chitinophaga sp.]|uniref:cold shock domain-containing protein n=1 Tax=Chitinophaga sp. TaxID=1869181 RepID=UPI002BF99F2D|nr:cold shock domain-containing protein [Chitinophaga sp.]HVI49036.1 cold shock domain-containing protein [Chitinophaga sp.]